MKIATILLMLCAVVVSAQELREGEEYWVLTPWVVELADGVILDPGRDGATKYRGIASIRFVREDLAILASPWVEHSAFYDRQPGATGSARLNFRLKDGTELTIQTSEEESGRRLYLYRIPVGLFFPDDRENDTPASDNTPSMGAETPVQRLPETYTPAARNDSTTSKPGMVEKTEILIVGEIYRASSP